MGAVSDREQGQAGRLTVALLGPLDVTVAGRSVPVTTGRLRSLLAVLAMSAGEPVSVDRAAAALWGEALPGNARRSVQTYVTRLRGVLGVGAIRTTPAGYRLRAEPDDVDALRFLRLLDEAARATDPATERARLAGALVLWRGTPFEGLRSDVLEQTEAPRLRERYLAGLERRVDLDLADGRHGDLVAELRELTTRHPLRESLSVRLLAALDRANRQAEALAEYGAIRVRLADELGTDPGPELRRVHADLLAGRRLTHAHDAGPATPGWLVAPRQLPADIEVFAGREATLAMLDDMLAAHDDLPTRSVLITAITGDAGVGKTTLAVHWAHRVAGRFPDGQLHLNLRGFDASGQAMDAGDAVRALLDAMGVRRLPVGLDAQAGLLRSLLAGRRVLMLLDNARDADQVRPLLPGAPGCLVVVTSRHQLPGLVTTEGARPVLLDLLPADEARLLLARRLGKDRVAAEPEAVAQIVTSCARLPLALAITAARAAIRPELPLATLAAELRGSRAGLDAFATNDPAADVRAVFSWSYRTLGAEAARLFRLLGLHPGPDTSVLAAASLAGLSPHQTRPLLVELCRAHLLTTHATGRYACHDLLRAYATELVQAHDSGADRHAAGLRMLDHYLHTAHAAARLLGRHREPITVAPPEPGSVVVVGDSLGDALAWFTAEHTGLVAAVGYAAGAGFDTHAWQLARTLTTFLDRQGLWRDLATTQHTALQAAQRLADPAGQAVAHRVRARALARLGRHDDALADLRQALDRYRTLGDRAGQAHTHQDLSMVLELLGRVPEALGQVEQALAHTRAVGDRTGQAMALNGIGWYHSLLGEHQHALTHCQDSLRLSQEIGYRHGEAYALSSLGHAHHHLDQLPQATDCYRRSVDLLRELGDRYNEAQVLGHLAEAHQATGDPGAARTAWRQALAILDELDHPDADQVRAKLAAMSHHFRT